MKTKKQQFIFLTLETRDGEREYLTKMICPIRDGESATDTAHREASEFFYSDVEKLDNFEYEHNGGETITKIERFDIIADEDLKTLQKYMV